MTAEELIVELQKLPPKTKVIIDDPFLGQWAVASVTVLDIFGVAGIPNYFMAPSEAEAHGHKLEPNLTTVAYLSYCD